MWISLDYHLEFNFSWFLGILEYLTIFHMIETSSIINRTFLRDYLQRFFDREFLAAFFQVDTGLRQWIINELAKRTRKRDYIREAGRDISRKCEKATEKEKKRHKLK